MKSNNNEIEILSKIVMYKSLYVFDEYRFKSLIYLNFEHSNISNYSISKASNLDRLDQLNYKTILFIEFSLLMYITSNKYTYCKR